MRHPIKHFAPSDQRRTQLGRLAIGAVLMIVPTLLGAKGCELADLGNNGSLCGGLAGAACKTGEFCNYPEDAMCGAADQTGTCEVMPEVCGEIYAPVCGCDDETYSNACEAHGAGVSVVKTGECDGDPGDGDGDSGDGDPGDGDGDGDGDCGGIAGVSCAKDKFCNFPVATRCGSGDQMGSCESLPEACDANYAPVCGCDGKTYGNECEANSAGISLAAEGECDTDPGAGDCGGIAGLTCEKDEFCNFPPETKCGSGDQMGSCDTMPEACEDIYDPVCGCDGETYGNQCEANGAGVSVASEGECDTDPGGRDCGGLLGVSCGSQAFCNYPKDAYCGAADQTGKCVLIPEGCDGNYKPVCGCDDQTYSNECEAHTAGVSVAQEGACKDDPNETVCGGLLGAQCPKDQFCSFSAEAMCGAADQTGLCAMMPEACTQQYDPVCGCDGKTYGNACSAASAGVSVASEGECDEGKECTSLVGSLCDKGQFCSFPIESMCGAGKLTGVCTTAPEACTEQYDPVCGCDGKTYGNACSAASAGISVASEGECKVE